MPPGHDINGGCLRASSGVGAQPSAPAAPPVVPVDMSWAH